MKGGFRRRNQKESPPAEGRQHPRVFLELPIQYRFSGRAARNGQTYNVSQGGVMVDIREKLEIGQGIELAIFFSLGPKVDTIKTDSRVVWVSDGDKKGTFRSGVKFTDVSAADKTKINKIVEG
ncbi:MAG TPA: PilZ domain-containing protein [Thermodesulfobacteriota bacterium]|nr:PilZ domain-containing protein [Thermodesulfobacteriota bacterium]